MAKSKSPIPFNEYDRIWREIYDREKVHLNDDLQLFAGCFPPMTPPGVKYWYIKLQNVDMTLVWELQYHRHGKYVILGDQSRIVNDITHYKMKK